MNGTPNFFFGAGIADMKYPNMITKVWAHHPKHSPLLLFWILAQRFVDFWLVPGFDTVTQRQTIVWHSPRMAQVDGAPP